MRVIYLLSLSVDLEINFEQSDYSIVEGSKMLSSPIMLQFRMNQNPFTITLSPVTVNTTEDNDLGFFINSVTIQDSFRAEAGMQDCYKLSNVLFCLL